VRRSTPDEGPASIFHAQSMRQMDTNEHQIDHRKNVLFRFAVVVMMEIYFI
jgi:hypothetical protein